MSKAATVALVLSVMTLALGRTAFAEVQLTIRDGRVTLVAKDATVRQILTEWARVGQTKVLNVERIPGGPVTLQLNGVPEEQALDILLRSVSGYMAAPRPTMVADLSRYDRILVLPTTAAPRAPVAAPPPAFQPPQVVQAPQVPPVIDDDRDENDQRPAQPVAVPPAGRAPVFNTFPPPQVLNPPQQMTPTLVPGATGGVPQQQPPAPAQTPPAPTTYPNQPTAPFGGVAVPGMIVPAPQQPNQQQPGQQRPQGQR